MIWFIFKSKMGSEKTTIRFNFKLLTNGMIVLCMLICPSCQGDHQSGNNMQGSSGISDSAAQINAPEKYQIDNVLLVSPENPAPGQPFRVMATGGENIHGAKISVTGPSGTSESVNMIIGKELPCWRIDDFAGGPAGKYNIALIIDKKILCNLAFTITADQVVKPVEGVWKTIRGWDSSTEVLYSAWINALFYGFDERSSWTALHEVTQNKNQNFLYNYLSLGEDDPEGKNKLVMEPDCADNPFYLRAYFAWKLGLPFGYHICNRGYLGSSPKTGQWITNENFSQKAGPVKAFNAFLRNVMNGVHSGTARTALNDENSDYYPVPVEHEALRPGIVFADPYGHTLILIGSMPQTNDHQGVLLAVDAQPDGTVGIKRFWKGNFLFNTTEVIGEPGFKAFRPITVQKGVPSLMKNKELISEAGFVPFSLQQRKMKSDVFYHTMERIINPKPLNPENALIGLIEALHEQLLVRVTSVANGEAFFKLHPGTVIPMPSGSTGIFQAGGQWEDFSTPNRDLRLLIAMDAVLDFPDHVLRSPDGFLLSRTDTPDQVNKKLLSILDEKGSELSISYTRSNGIIQKLTVGEILKRREAFEMAYNPNDGIEIRWGAPDNSDEMSSCKRHSPSNQIVTMRSVRIWFKKRLHPPT
jgi:hypothetical protein